MTQPSQEKYRVAIQALAEEILIETRNMLREAAANDDPDAISETPEAVLETFVDLLHDGIGEDILDDLIKQAEGLLQIPSEIGPEKS